MGYKYQMHAHTYPCSACAKRDMEELVEYLSIGGYNGCVITNHFYHGNSGISRSLPWNEFVKQYEEDYLEGKKLAEKYDLDIIFGIEEGVGGGLEILCYGITPEILYNHPELRHADLETWTSVLKPYEVLIIQAHPFRERDYIYEPMLLPAELIDGIEVFNVYNDEYENGEAEIAAKNNPGFILTSGADSHLNDDISIAGIDSEMRIRDEKDLVEVLKCRKYNLIYANEF